jgi:hypothetical protein
VESGVVFDGQRNPDYGIYAWMDSAFPFQVRHTAEHVMASAQHYLGSQGVADDTLLYNKVLRKIKAAQGSVVQMILNLTNDATPLPKLGMRTTRQHVERAAQTAAYGKEVQVTPHLVFVVIMECAKQGKKDAARIRKEAMQQLLGTKICKDPQTLLGNLQTFEDLKISYESEFAMQFCQKTSRRIYCVSSKKTPRGLTLCGHEGSTTESV